MSLAARLPRIALLVMACLCGPAGAAQDYSEAERVLFMADQLASAKPPLTLQYRYRKSGSLEPGFDDKVSVVLTAQADGRCCAANTSFLTGERRITLPEIEDARGNPVILHFLERDIHEMQRLTRGQHNYFRKRIRMAVYQGATIRPVRLAWRGQAITGQEITITPYRDDPLRARFEKLAGKEYVFTLSAAVPGGVYAIHTRVPGDGTATGPLIAEDLRIDGAADPAPSRPL